MVGLTLTPEQIRTAPPEVRHWLEQEFARSLRAEPEIEATADGFEHFIALSPDEATAVYAAIRGALPVVNVFFELGREGASLGEDGIEAYPLIDLARQARLANLEHLARCLQAIDNVVRALRHDPNATIFAIDRRGYCLIAAKTQASIAELWQDFVEAHSEPEMHTHGFAATHGETAPLATACPIFPVKSGAMPAAFAHFEDTVPVRVGPGAA